MGRNVMTISVPKVRINDTATSFTGGRTWTIKNAWAERQIEKIGKYSSPESRLILGATALVSQPYIDSHNKNVDEDTRKVSTARTIAKIIVGTTTGYLIRKGCINLIGHSTIVDEQKLNKIKKPFMKKIATALLPDNVPLETVKNAEKLLKKHKNALGTCLALIVMLFTNFAIDAPLTKILTNTLNKKNTEKGGN